MAKRAKVERYDDVVVGLDVGTTKICAVVCRRSSTNKIDVIGVGKSPSYGIRKGVVINIEATVDSVKSAIEEAEQMAGLDIINVYAGIAGGHIKGFNSHGMVAIRDREITTHDVHRVIDAAKAVAIPLDREVIHIIPQEFVVDDQDGIRDPVGMSGVRLETNVHIVTGAVSSAQNIIKCANRAGLNVEDIVLEPLASAQAVLSADEKELGVVLIDIGGGTTDVAMFSAGSIVHTCVLALGGNHITNDVAVGLRTPVQEAEKLKIKFGSAHLEGIDSERLIAVAGVGGRSSQQVKQRALVEIIGSRMEEIFSLVHQEMQKSGFWPAMASGVVISGGSSLLSGTTQLAERILGVPVKLGRPQGFGGLSDVVSSPIYATSVGLGLYGFSRPKNANRFRIREDRIYLRVRDRMRTWFGEIF